MPRVYSYLINEVAEGWIFGIYLVYTELSSNYIVRIREARRSRPPCQGTRRGNEALIQNARSKVKAKTKDKEGRQEREPS